MANQVEFLTVEEFKDRVNENKLSLVRSPKTNKLFLAGEKNNWKVQGDIDVSKDMRMLIENDNTNESCLVNVKQAGEVLATF